MSIKKLLLGVLTFLFLTVIGLVWGPRVYYYTILPSTKKIEQSATLGDAFSNWNIKAFDREIPKDANLPPEIIKCAICGGKNPDLDSCKSRLTLGMIHVLVGGSRGRQIFWNYKGYQLHHTMLLKYDFPVLYKLFFASYLHMLQTNNIESFCLKTYKKACAKISDEEAIDLDTRIFVSSSYSRFTEVRSARIKKCLK